jgi:pimeloyl-ACP methyl ester carboxylesterase
VSDSRAVKVLFLNGWSLDSSFVEPLLQALGEGVTYQVFDVDARFFEDSWPSSLVSLIDQDTVIMGWSLGGMLAIRLAAFLEKNQRDYRKLVTLMASPSFINREGWSCGMSESDFAQFKMAAESDQLVVKTFPYLMLGPKQSVVGTSETTLLANRTLLSEIRQRYRGSLQSSENRIATLALLEQLDLRKELSALQQQAILLFAEDDLLVPNMTAQVVEQLYPHHHVHLVEGEGHLLNAPILKLVSTLLGLSLGTSAAVTCER